MSDRIDIVIADDHPLVRTGLRHVIEKDGQCLIVAEAEDGKTALEQFLAHRPAIAILDLEMPFMNGLEVARRVLADRLPTAIIVLTMYDEEDLYHEAMEIGVLGYLLKDSASRDVLKAIRSALRGEYYISPSLSNYTIRPRHPMPVSLENRLGLQKLTESERRILQLVADQKTSAEIAAMLSISAKTVDNHRTNICHKLGLTGINSLTRFALTHRASLRA